MTNVVLLFRAQLVRKPKLDIQIAVIDNTSGYAVRTEVHCGLARDKSNDQYRISTALRRSCPVN